MIESHTWHTSSTITFTQLPLCENTRNPILNLALPSIRIWIARFSIKKNCSEIALKLLLNCSNIALKLPRNYSNIALKLL